MKICGGLLRDEDARKRFPDDAMARVVPLSAVIDARRKKL
jgi:hypothetical protein